MSPYRILELPPIIQRKIESEQWLLSENLIDRRFELDYPIEKMATIADVEMDIYLKLEYFDIDIPVAVYVKALHNLDTYILIKYDL